MLRGCREYQPGDSWKHINWRMAAREQGTPVNLYQTIQPRGLRFLLDGESFCGLSQDWRELEGPWRYWPPSFPACLAQGWTAPSPSPLPPLRSHDRLLRGGRRGRPALLSGGLPLPGPAGPRGESLPQGPAFLPSRFAADAAPQSGTAYLITCSGSRLPAALMERLDPGQLWVLCAQDWEVPAQAGFRSLSLDSLRKGGEPPMNQSRSCLVDLAGLLSNVTALHTLFSIFAFRQTGRSDPAGLLIWCVCLSLTCGGLALFLRRPRTQRSILLLALAALALQGAVVWLWGVRYPSLLSWLCLLAMWGFSYFRCYELLIRPTPAEQLMVSFETASLVLLAAALCTAAGVLPLDTAWPPAAGTLLALAALAGQRASNSRPGGQAAGSRGVCSFSPSAGRPGRGRSPCACCCSPAPPPRPSPPLTGWLRELASGALALLDRFFRWLFSLFPAPETGSLNLPDPISAAGGPAGEAVQSSDAVLYVLAGLVLLAGVGAILWALRRGGSRTRSHPPIRRGRVVDRRSPRDTLAMLWSGWRTASASSSPTWPGGIPPAGVLVAGPPPEAPPQGPPAGGDLPRLPDRAAAELPGCAQELGSWPAVWTSSTSAAEPPPSPQPEPQSSRRAPAPGLPSAGEARTALTPLRAPRSPSGESWGAFSLSAVLLVKKKQL